MITAHVVANARIHQHAIIHTNMTHTHASVPASLTSVPLISTFTMIPVVANVVKSQPARAISTSMIHNVNVSALI